MRGKLEWFWIKHPLYADDIVLIAPDEPKLQLMLEFVSSWCKNGAWWWTQIKHKLSTFGLLENPELDLSFILAVTRCNWYQTINISVDKQLSVKKTAIALSEAAGRALGAIRYRLIFLKECMLSTFTTLFSSCDFPILMMPVFGVSKNLMR